MVFIHKSSGKLVRVFPMLEQLNISVVVVHHYTHGNDSVLLKS